MKAKYFYTVLVVTMLCLSGTALFAQTGDKEFCSGNNWSNGDNVSFREAREMTLPAANQLSVDGKQNGGIRVKGSDRADILVRSCIQTWADSDSAARAIAQNVRIEKSPTVHAENSSDNSHWSVSYEVLVPRSINLQLTAHNGGININDVEGNVEFETMNGGVMLNQMAGSVKGRTTNGGVAVRLSGSSWKGSGLDVETSNGGVSLVMPENYAARVETGTVNGRVSSSINGLTVEKNESRTYYRPGGRINTSINGGGAPIRVITTNGGVSISSGK